MKNQRIINKQLAPASGKNSHEVDLAYKQALQYGQDMVAIYKQERRKRKALEVAYKKLEAALESMSDGFLVVDQNLSITEMNQAGADLFGTSPSDAQGKLLSELLVGGKTEDFYHRLLRGKPQKLNTQLDLLLPQPRTVSLQGAPLPGGGWILVLHDVTWEQRVNNMREEFLHLAAHELRTPLSGVMGFTSMLEQIADKHNLDDEIRSILAHILNSSDRLRRTVKDLMDFTFNNSKEAEAEVVDLRKVVEDALTLLNKLAIEHSVTVKVSLPSETTTIFGHKEMLVTAVGHLIENGIRYNKPGGSLTIEERCDADNYYLIFSDTGIGISRKDLDYIMQPFFQAEEHSTRSSVGMGLGLSIAQRTFSLHHGVLEAASKLGEGSTFKVTFPNFKTKDIADVRQEWLEIQKRLNQHLEDNAAEEQANAQTIIDQLKQQLEVMQSQSMAYAQDLTRLYQLQRADIQAIEEKEAIISHTDRLALMGQLAAGVAHDLGNLISPILGYSQIILRRRDLIDPTMADITERILRSSRRANVLLRQMVTLSKPQSGTFENIDFSNLIKEMLQILEVKIRCANIDLVEFYVENQDWVYGNSIQLSQVILNLLINAIDAMPDGGVLTIKTSPGRGSALGYVQFQIADTGCGIEPENIARIFEAFFTTKSEKSGTGLGLSVTKQIIDKHAGQISVDSVEGKGTIFTLLFPTPEKYEELAKT